MKTLTILIGNTDNKLTQQDWAEFVRMMGATIKERTNSIFFDGGPHNASKFQNWCWVAEFNISKLDELFERIEILRKRYKQDSAAVIIEGETKFI